MERKMRRLIGVGVAMATIALGAGAADAAKRPVFSGRPVGSTAPCEHSAAENGQGAHFEDRGGGVCWVVLP
ncbi:MAG: hypothetical protein LC808_10920 [Actinobacteria bacterium]|nr:hypothetical protein [Actinomycetota bacterium]